MSEGLKPCPFCGGEAEVLDTYRYMKQRPSCNKSEIVCNKCGLTIKCDRSTHILIKAWNRRMGE